MYDTISRRQVALPATDEKIENPMRAAFKAILVLSFAAAGCRSYSEPFAQSTKPPTPAERNFETVWQASRDVLGDYYWTLDRQDRRAGVITTMPLTGKHWFEFWRSDTATAGDLAESTIQMIYRTVKISIRPTAPGANTYAPFVEVKVVRSNLETMQVTSTSEAVRLFYLSGSSSNKGRKIYLLDRGRAVEKKASASALGRDHELEAKIRADILAASGSAAAPAPRPARIRNARTPAK